MTSPDNMSADELAKACADSMWSTDSASQALGMKLVEVRSGYAELTMCVREDMLNGQRSCHGGMLFSLADSAFAFACNGYNQFSVAQQCSISFIAPAFEGDVLTAKALERIRAGRSGIYDISVTNKKGEVIAEFRGNSRTIKGQHIESKENQ